MVAMRHAGNTLLVTKSLGEIIFLSLVSEDLSIFLKWDYCAVHLYSCHNSLLPFLKRELLTQNPDQRREEHSVCTGLTTSFSPSSPFPSPILLSFPVVAAGRAVSDKTLSLSFHVPVLLFVADTPQQAAELLGGECCEDFSSCQGNNWAQWP